MPRRRVAEKRTVQPDPKYGSQVIAKFINRVMRSGKKSTAERIVYGALNIITEKNKGDSLVIFERALEHVRPILEVKSRRVGGATYQVPVEVQPDRAMALAMRWLVEAALARNEQGMMNKLANEILDASDETSSVGASKGKGGAVKKREDTHRMADANKAFSHYHW